MTQTRYLHALFFAALVFQLSQSQPFDPFNPPLDRFPFLQYATLYEIGYYWSPTINTNPLKKDNDAIIVKFQYQNGALNTSFQKPPNNVNILSFTEHQPFDRPNDQNFPLKLQYNWMKKKVTRLFNPIINESIPNINVSGYILRNVFRNTSSNLVNNSTNFTGQIQEVPLFKITGQNRPLTRAQYSFTRAFEVGVNQAMSRVNGRTFKLLTRAYISNVTKWTQTLLLNYTFFFQANHDYVVSMSTMRQKPVLDKYANGFNDFNRYEPPPKNLVLPKNPFRFLNNLQVCISRIIQLGYRMMPEITTKNEGPQWLYNKFTDIFAYELPNNEGTQFYLHYRPWYKTIDRFLNATLNGTCIKINGTYQQTPVNLTGSFTNYTLVWK